MKAISAHFSEAERFTWTPKAGGPDATFDATVRTGIPDTVITDPTGLYLYVSPANMPTGATRGDTVTRIATGLTYNVIEVIGRVGAFTGVSLEKKK